ncbi:MAG: hypothetical protein Q8R83_04300 [Legionellaceae bacterium]|nr:hypothetical protein [Legionellaceae bacterium]
MKKYLFSAALILSLNAFAAGNVPLEGTYACKGHEVGTEAAFSCQMIIKKTGETYASTATCSDGNSYRGTGIYDKNSHRLSTGFINPKKSEETGVSVSTIKAHGQLVSAWTYLDKTSIAYTTCQKSK